MLCKLALAKTQPRRRFRGARPTQFQSLLTRPVESARASAASPPRTCLPPGKPFGLSAGRGNAHGSRLHVI